MNVDPRSEYGYPWICMVPHSVRATRNRNASNTRSVPSQMYLFSRRSSAGANTSAYLVRIREFTPSAAITRSYAARSSSASGASVR